MFEALFRYVLIRPPTEIPVGKPIPLKSESPFQGELEQLRNMGDDATLSRIREQASRFIQSDYFIDRIDKLAFGTQLKALITEVKKDEEPQDILNELREMVNRTFNALPSAIISTEQFGKDLRNIRDSIVAIKIDNNPSHATNLFQLVDLLCGLSCISDIEHNKEYLNQVTNYRDLFERQLALPEEIFPLTIRRESQERPAMEPTSIAITDLRDELNERLANIKKLENALNELRSFDPRDLEIDPSHGKTVFALKREALDKLSSDTVKIIREKMKMDPSRLPIDRIIHIANAKVVLEHKEIADLQSKLGSTRAIRAIGTSLIGFDRSDISSSMLEATVATSTATTTASSICIPKTHGSIKPIGSQLGFNNIFLVAHDVGAQTAYSYAAAHPNNVSKLVLMDFPFPGFLPPAFGQNGPWWFAFYQTPDIPETLIDGKEREYLSWFMKGLAYDPSAISEAIDVFANHAKEPGGLRPQFEHFRAFPADAEQNKESAKSKITMPVLVLGGDIYPALGGDYPGNFALDSTQALATNVTGITVPFSGHWIPEEQPQFVIEQLAKFFGE